MPRFFVTDGSLTPDVTEVTLTGEDARHISLSLRMAVGEEVTLADGRGWEYSARLSAMTKETVTAEVLSSARSTAELPFPIHLYMGFPKGDKLDTVIEKAVELGAATVTPFLSSRCIRRPAAEKGERLLERCNRIARGAAGQCGRALLPEVRPTLSYEEMLKAATACALPLFCYEGEGTEPLGRILASHPHPASVAVIVGSEGGFSPEEADAALAAGCVLTGLGKRILRCETAPLLALSCLGFFYDFGQTT